MNPRRWFVTGAMSIAMILVGALSVQAVVSQHRSRPLDRQNIGVLGRAQSSHTNWRDYPLWGASDGPGIQARRGVAVTLSATVEGGPVMFRVYLEVVNERFKVRYMVPVAATFDPGAGRNSFSFTFVKALDRGLYTVNLQWRSPTGVPVTTTGGSMVIQYAAA